MILRAASVFCGSLFAAAFAAGCTCDLAELPTSEEGESVANDAPSEPLSPPPRLGVVQTKRPPVLDGALSDPVWSFARTTGPFVETRRGGPAAVEANAKLLWDDRFLYVAVDVRDTLLRASDMEHDAHLWEQDCVELMIDPDGDGNDYFEIQVSPRGVVFDTRYDSRRVPQPFGHLGWDSRTRVGVSARGGIDDAKSDGGYSIEIAIPWQAFSPGAEKALEPAVGDRWRANLYVMDVTRDRQRAAAWSPLGTGDFHVPQRFGILVFEGAPEGMTRTSEPVRISSDRMPKSMERGAGTKRGSTGSVIRERASDPRKPARPPRSPIRTDAQRLESPEGAH